MNKKVLATAVAATSLIATSTATAYDNHGWFWSPAKMENAIYDEGLPWMDADHEVTNSNCRGLKPAWRHNGTLLYKRFRCSVETDMLGGSNGWGVWTYKVNAYVLGKDTWTAVRLPGTK